MRTGVAAVYPVVFIYEGLVPMLLRPQGPGHILGARHDAAALVVEAENGRHTVSAGRAFQRRGHSFVIPDAPGAGPGSCRESGGDKGLLFHPRLCAQRTCHIVEIPDLVPLVRGEGQDPIPAGGHPAIHAEGRCHISGQISVISVEALYDLLRLRDKGLHLHIAGRHQSAGHAVQVDALVPLVDVVGFRLRRGIMSSRQARLYLERHLQFLRKVFPSNLCSAQDTHTGGFRQIMLRIGIWLQNIRQRGPDRFPGGHSGIERRLALSVRGPQLPMALPEEVHRA